MDTVTLARQEREKQGQLEVEITYGGEADLHRHLTGCTKNPGHTKFVPVDQFNVDHLPPGCQDDDLVELVRALSALTVRVTVEYVSENRPETDPITGKDYPLYKDRGKQLTRVGSGVVFFVDKYPDKYGRYTACFCEECLFSPTPKICECDECLESDAPKICQCHECLNSPTPKTQFAHIVMLTAVHVVYDELEGAQTTCHLFFDRGSTPKKCKEAVALQGMLRVKSDGSRDWCEMTFVTHDMDLANKLETVYERWELIKEKMENKYRRLFSENQPSTESVPDILKTLALLVSHPHGCSKQVSVGNYTSRDLKENTDGRDLKTARYTYTTPSCPGSSGAPVYFPARSWCGYYDTNVHSGGAIVATGDQLNYTCFGSELVNEESDAGSDTELVDKISSLRIM